MTLRDSGTFKKSQFHSPRNTFATIMGIFDDPENHINQLLRHDDGSYSLDLYSGGACERVLEEVNGEVELKEGD